MPEINKNTTLQKAPNGLIRLWRHFTEPVATDFNDARIEYMTKVILLIICLVTLPFLIIAFIGWLGHSIPLDTVIILVTMLVFFSLGWYITNKGYRKIGGLIPCILLFAIAIFGNYIGGIDAPAMLIYALVIVLAAIMLGTKAQMIFLALSLISFASIGLAHYTGLLSTTRSASNMFVNRVSIAFAAITAITLGVWFLKHQYQSSINQANATTNNIRVLLDTIIDGILYSDLVGNIIDLNEACLRMFGQNDKQQVLGRNIVEFLAPEDQNIADRIHDEMLEHSKTGSMSGTGVLPGGEKIAIEINSALLFDALGKPTGFVSTIRDVTQRKKSEEELIKYRDHLEEMVNERTEKLKEAYDELESFSYSISHDLRSPLRSMNGYVSLIDSDPENKLNETSRRYIAQIKESSSRMGDLISDLLSFSRLMRQPVTRKTVNPGLIAKEVKEELLKSDYCSLNCEIQITALPSCEADPILLRQVFFNLLDNALKYSHNKNKPIVLIGSKKADNGENVYFVQDNGIGFDMQYSDKLFGVFQRLHRDTEYNGTGIGLATVQRIIRRHNGRIWFESTPNQETTFFFTIGKD